MPTPRVLSVNVGAPMPDPHKPHQRTGIDKRPVDAIDVFAPGRKVDGVGGGVRGDFLGDLEHHGGDLQAVYAVARDDLDHYQQVLGRELGNGWMGENLTLTGLDPNESIVGEHWSIGDAEVRVTSPRIPCGTFRGWAGRAGWLKEVTASGRVGSYLAVVRPGCIRPGDEIAVRDVPAHGVTIRQLFWALTLRSDLAHEALAARADLDARTVQRLERRDPFVLG